MRPIIDGLLSPGKCIEQGWDHVDRASGQVILCGKYDHIICLLSLCDTQQVLVAAPFTRGYNGQFSPVIVAMNLRKMLAGMDNLVYWKQLLKVCLWCLLRFENPTPD